MGRYANRISHATFTIDGKHIHWHLMISGNTLHGGMKGFDKVIWNVNQVNDSSLALILFQPGRRRRISRKPECESGVYDHFQKMV